MTLADRVLVADPETVQKWGPRKVSEPSPILWPQYEQRVSHWVFPVMFGKLAIMLWLIIMGAKQRQPQVSAT